MALNGKLVRVDQLSPAETDQMFHLMHTFYDNMERAAFYSDLSRKDTCILLRGEKGDIRGFSTQQLLHIDLPGERVHGVFSGDTIIHPDEWGSLALHKVFSRHYFPYGERYGEFYWFLISKGYKTYKILPTFFREFYPSCLGAVPEREQRIIDAFGALLYPGEYNPATGVVEYHSVKDRLKPGVADITPRLARDKHVAYFLRRNPGYTDGNDLVCLARLSKVNLFPRPRTMLFGKEAEE